MQNRHDKKTRLQTIRMIVSSQVVCSQEDLMIELDKAGFPCTQTTLSRDLKQLRISKVRGKSGHSAYALPHEGQFLVPPSREEQERRKWSVRFSANIMVVHTPPGHASMVAVEIDSAAHPFFLGSVAGDDTVLVVLAENVEREDARSVILGIVPQLDNRHKDGEINI
ncbi:MAG: arginine repressor [Bacteroidaceae bacterium]